MKHIARLFLLTLFVGLIGCARAYYQYPSGCVSYGYCPAAPLPYAAYSGCPTPLAANYAGSSLPQPAARDEADGDSATAERP